MPWFKFTAHRDEGLYGYGTAADAAQLTGMMNSGRNRNHFAAPRELSEAEATRLKLAIGRTGFAIAEEIERHGDARKVHVLDSHSHAHARAELSREDCEAIEHQQEALKKSGQVTLAQAHELARQRAKRALAQV